MKKEISVVILLWLIIVGGFLGWNIKDEKIANDRLAFNTGQAFFQLLVITRTWNAGHGGVYVPVTPKVQPNPYLDDPLRDLTTDQGITLTKINPAFMTRQIAEIAFRNGKGVQFHITSLNPIRPENQATDWEKNVLKSFEKGGRDKGEFFYEGSEPYFRYMAPLITEDSCLKCHAKQGYKKGDIRGGISITIPNFSNKLNRSLLIGYGFAAVFGVNFIFIGGMLLSKKQGLLIQANQSLKYEIEERQKTYHQLEESKSQVNALSGIVPICMHCKGIRDDKGYWNQLEKFISEHSEAQFSHSICEKCIEKYYPD
jgi:hypothetical protein